MLLYALISNVQIFHWGWISAVVAAQFRLPISAYVLDGQYFLHRSPLSPSPRLDVDLCLIGCSSTPVKPAHTSKDEGGLDEDADRTLLSTPPRDIHAHILSPSARSKSETADFVTRDCPEIDLRAVSRSRQTSTQPRRRLVVQSQHEVDELHEERTLVYRYVRIHSVELQRCKVYPIVMNSKTTATRLSGYSPARLR